MAKRTWIVIFALFAVSLLVVPHATRAAEDRTAPQLTAFDISPTTIDTSESDQQITITMHLTDDLSGVCYYNQEISYSSSACTMIGQIQVDLLPLIGTQKREAVFDWHLISGTVNDGVFQHVVTIPKWSKSGIWTVAQVYLIDALGNRQEIHTDELNAMFPGSQVTFVNTQTDTSVLVENAWTISSFDGKISATFPVNTEITRKSGGSFALYKMVNQEYSVSSLTDDGQAGKPVKTIQMGIPGLNLEFSKPVAISMRVDASLAGETLSIQTLEEDGTRWANETSCVVAYHGRTKYQEEYDAISQQLVIVRDQNNQPVVIPDPTDESSYGTCDFTVSHASYFSANQMPYVVTGVKAGGTPVVRVYSVSGQLQHSFFAYTSTFRKGVNVATGDLDGDGIDEIITSPAAGGGPQIRIFDVTGVNKKLDFFAYDLKFRGGVYIAAGDVDGDGVDEVVTAPMGGGASHIRVFKLVNGSMQVAYPSFFAYNLKFRGGTSVTIGDINGDGRGEIITTPTSNGGPHVQVFVLRNGQFTPAYGGIMAYAPSFRGGISATTGDVDSDGKDEIITAVVGRGGPHVRIFGLNSTNQIMLENAGFMAYDPGFRGGITVASADVNNDGVDDIITGVGGSGNPTIRFFNPSGQQILDEFNAYARSYKGGVSLAVGTF